MALDHTNVLKADGLVTKKGAGDVVYLPDGLGIDRLRNYVDPKGITCESPFNVEEAFNVGTALVPRVATIEGVHNVNGRIAAQNVETGWRFLLTLADLQAAGAVAIHEFYLSPRPHAGEILIPTRAFARVNDAFGPGVPIWSVGWLDSATLADDPDGILLVGDSAAALGYYQQLAAHKGLAIDGSQELVLPADANPTVKITIGGGTNFSDLVSGELEIFLWHLRIPVL